MGLIMIDPEMFLHLVGLTQPEITGPDPEWDKSNQGARLTTRSPAEVFPPEPV